MLHGDAIFILAYAPAPFFRLPRHISTSNTPNTPETLCPCPAYIL